MLASKVFFNEGALSRKAIEREIDGTLARLQTDYLDLYIIHRFDYSTPIEETMEALDSLVRAGKVRALGASAMYGYQFHNMQLSADANGWTRFSSMQNHYNLLYREDERELIPVCQQYGVSLTPYSPLASGHLTRPTWDSDSTRSTTDGTMRNKYDRGREIDMPIVTRVAELASRYDVPMADVALAWHWAKGVAAPHRRLLAPEPRRRRRARPRPHAHRRGHRLPRGTLPPPRARRPHRAPRRQAAGGHGRPTKVLTPLLSRSKAPSVGT